MKATRKSIPVSLPKEYEVIREQLSQALDANVKISVGVGNSGKLTLPFKNTDDLKALVQKIMNN